MSDPLEGVKLKVERANSHIQEVNNLINFLTAPDGYEIITEIDSAKGEKTIKIRLLKEPPVGIGVICGEILYGLRSALDHLVTATATRGDVVMIQNTGFPIEETQEKFEAAVKNRKIKQRLPELADVLNSLQPYKGGGYEGFLWWLHWLNGMEKHKIIVAMVGTHVGWHYDFILKPLPGFDSTKDHVIKVPKKWQLLEKEPVTLFVHPATTEIHGNMDLQLNVAFRDIETPHPWAWLTRSLSSSI